MANPSTSSLYCGRIVQTEGGQMRPTVVFDFDGTLALGSGPVLAYARHVADTAGDAGFVDAGRAAIARFEAGDESYLDGYDAVRRVAAARGVPDEVLGVAYLASRQDLGTPAAPVEAPDGLEPFLADLARRARLVLATNAPADGVDAVLEAVGAAAHLSERHFAIGKPAGLAAIVVRYLAEGPVLAVGDIWENDLAPADALGAATALVGAACGRADAHPTMRGATLTALYGEIQSWAATATHHPSAPTGVDPVQRKA